MRVLVKSFSVTWMDGSVGKLYLQNLSSHDSLVSSVLLGWLQGPHMIPTSCSESGAPHLSPLPLSLALISLALISRNMRPGEWSRESGSL